MPTPDSNNIEAYKILFELERMLRDFISKTLQRSLQLGWTNAIPNNIMRECERRASRERESYQEISPQEDGLIIDYADFKDLKTIILSNWEIFEPYFIRREMIENKLEELEIPRNTIAHNRIISITELHRIDVYASDLKRCMSRAVPA